MSPCSLRRARPRSPAGRAAREGTDSLAAFAEAAAGLPWVVCERRVLPDRVERSLRLLEAPQQASRARRYVG